MSNMSYCRFRNTLSDLIDCDNNWEDREMDIDEQRARNEMIRLIQDMANNYEETEIKIPDYHEDDY